MTEQPYTPTTEEVIRSFAIPPARVIERAEGESFAEYLSRLSIEGHGHQMESEAAAHRWLRRHDAEVWEEGFAKGFYSGQAMPGDSDASESQAVNPYETATEEES